MLLALGGIAGGDGGTVRLLEAVGPFIVTVFSLPEPLRAGRADLSVLVQERTSGAAILDADVHIDLEPPPGSTGAPIHLRADRAAATNKLLYAAPFEATLPGAWRARIRVSRGDQVAEVTGSLPVVAPIGGLAAIWPYLALPPAACALFALHLWLKTRRQRPAVTA